MRELKFRAWCEKIQYYFYDVAIYPNGVVARKSNALLDTLTEGETHWHELDNAVIEQYTGLKDKNGKEIYEGDILQDVGGDTATVIWRVPQAEWGIRWSINKAEDSLSHRMFWCGLKEVIGNIHENPELLEHKG